MPICVHRHGRPVCAPDRLHDFCHGIFVISGRFLVVMGADEVEHKTGDQGVLHVLSGGVAGHVCGGAHVHAGAGGESHIDDLGDDIFIYSAPENQKWGVWKLSCSNNMCQQMSCVSYRVL